MRNGIPEPYEQLKALTRGRAVTKELIREFIATLDIPPAEKARLLELEGVAVRREVAP